MCAEHIKGLGDRRLIAEDALCSEEAVFAPLLAAPSPTEQGGMWHHRGVAFCCGEENETMAQANFSIIYLRNGLV